MRKYALKKNEMKKHNVTEREMILRDKKLRIGEKRDGNLDDEV